LLIVLKTAIKCRFQIIFETEDPILAAVVLPKFKLKWVESQKKEDEYNQMLLQAMLEQSNDEVEARPETQEESQGSKSKKSDFDDDEKSSQVNVEVEANDYLRSAKSIEFLHKYHTIKKHFQYVQYHFTIKCSSRKTFQCGAVLTAKRNRLGKKNINSASANTALTQASH